MEKQKITLHRALSELKVIDSRIEKNISNLNPMEIYQKGKLLGNHSTEDDFKKDAQSSWDSTEDLIKRKLALKTAIVAKNAETTVTVGGKQMTIADAITMKDFISIKKTLLEVLIKTKRNAESTLSKNNDLVKANLQKILEATFGRATDNISAGDADAVAKPYLEANEFHLFDAINTNEKIKALEEEIYNFEVEVDAVLSEVNAITTIEI